ncbi:hypothetical protein V9L05_02155 [Bernardetia sp. Wsw4-3y2]|uniref:hypothetical protein n=1 Tax=Bernardetia sp. Wsw4-3y2 TaxID=3127471 RepID=UPI0030CEE0E6
MHHSHQLEKQTHKDFLLQQRVDPITGELIEAGHKIVICSACKSAFFEESWEYLGGKHCNQEKTLIQIPINETLWLKAKPLQFLPFDFVGFDKGFHYQDVVFGFIGLITTGFFGISIMLCLMALGKEEFKIFFILFPIFAFAFFLFLSSEKNIKKLPPSIYKHILNIHKEHKLAIDIKKQMLIFRNDFKELELPLDTISKFQYSFKYVDGDTSRYKDMCNLNLTLGFSKNGIYKERKINAQLRKLYFYKWEEFLQKLPDRINIYTQ